MNLPEIKALCDELEKNATYNESGQIALTSANLEGMKRLYLALPTLSSFIRQAVGLVEDVEKMGCAKMESDDAYDNGFNDGAKAMGWQRDGILRKHGFKD